MSRVLFPYPLLAVLSAFAQSAAAQAPTYTVKDLGPMGPLPGQPFVVTNDGLISEMVGVSDGVWHAMLQFHGTRIDLAQAGGLGGPSSAAYGHRPRWAQRISPPS